ncbi:MAG: DsrE/DsrF/DrsH-like family protein [Gemmatimonadota bacterium]|nr:MAG: DsrE/DsrF/DrsH-like family protein [Gemmatimonadota bacterium]
MAEKQKNKRLALVVSKGTLDNAYAPLILASTAVSMDWECGLFFTFYGLDILNKKKLDSLKVPPLANPAMPIAVPNMIGVLPGMTAMATGIMKKWMDRAKLPPLRDLIEIAQEGGAIFFACTTTMEVMGLKKEDLIDGIQLAGASTFLEYASESEVNLYI